MTQLVLDPHDVPSFRVGPHAIGPPQLVRGYCQAALTTQLLDLFIQHAVVQPLIGSSNEQGLRGGRPASVFGHVIYNQANQQAGDIDRPGDAKEGVRRRRQRL